VSNQSPLSSADEIRAQVEKRLRAEEEGLGPEAPPPDPGPPTLSPEFVEECLDNNERGDGVLYATLMRNRFVYVKKREKRPWLVWHGHHWAVDIMGEYVWAVEEVALVYLQAAENLSGPITEEREQYSEANARVKRAEARAKELRGISGADSETKTQAEAEVLKAESEAAQHLTAYKALQRKKKRYMERVDRLRSKPGVEKCVWFAHHFKNRRPLAIEGDEIDKKPMLLPCANGVINLCTGRLQDGVPSDYLLRAIPVEYPEHLGKDRIRRYLETGEDFPFPAWERFIESIVYPNDDGTPNLDIALCLQKLLGNSITGDTSLQKIVIVVGDGRNGKGVLFQTIQKMLGELAWTIKSELLLDQKQQRSTAGPSPEIMALRYRRLVVASETDKHRYISGARVKEFSGGDQMNARDMFGVDEENFDPTHHLWLQTNNIPGGVTKEFSLRQRLVIFDLPYRYVDDPDLEARKTPHLAQWFRPIDKELKKRLDVGHQYILLWLIRGAMLVQRDGLEVPDKLRADMENLQLLEDNLEQYLRNGCLQDWDPDRIYEEGDLVNVKDTVHPNKNLGRVFVSRRDQVLDDLGKDPESSPELWSHQGVGLDPERVTLFKEFYSAYKRWYLENITEKEKDLPSSKNVAADLRKKGYEVKSKGGQLKIFAEVRPLAL